MKHLSIAMVALAVFATLACATADGPPMTDQDIQAAVVEEFRQTTDLDWTQVSVGVTNAVVTLSGTVNTTAQRLAAEQAAHRVRNVARVVNNITVR